MPLCTETQDIPGELRIALVGSLCHADHDHFRRMLGEAETTTRPRLVFDLTRLETIDSAGLGMLLMARERAAGRFAIVLLRPGGQVLRMLRLVEFHHLFAVE